MDAGELLFIASRLGSGALAAFLAIAVWSKTRDTAWMLAIAASIAAYVDTIYTILNRFGILYGQPLMGRSAAVIVLSNLWTVFLAAAFVVILVRKFRQA